MSFEEFYANLEKGIKQEPLDPDYPDAPDVAMETEVEDTSMGEDNDNLDTTGPEGTWLQWYIHTTYKIMMHKSAYFI